MRVPSTAGMPRSRAKIAPWLSAPPESVTTASAPHTAGAQDGSSVGSTKIVSGVSCFITDAKV